MTQIQDQDNDVGVLSQMTHHLLYLPSYIVAGVLLFEVIDYEMHYSNHRNVTYCVCWSNNTQISFKSCFARTNTKVEALAKIHDLLQMIV